MKKWLVLLCCAFLLASWLTTGLTQSLVELAAFVTMVTLMWRYSVSAKVDDVEQRTRADNQPEQ